ncbi:hypothetical protein HYX04_00240 [Candidatus Woesearchaeota archaeon]|nr:hypothetical protein [Candidatus Woesearchaeota archaeon]
MVSKLVYKIARHARQQGTIMPALVLWASLLLSLSLCMRRNFPKMFFTRSKLYAK